MQILYEVPEGEMLVFDATVHALTPLLAVRAPDPLMLQVTVLGVNRPVPGRVLSVVGARVNVTCPEVTGLSA